MTNASQQKPIPTPALLVYGKPTSPDLPQASWFHAEDRPTVVAAAHSLKFSVLDIQADAEKALTLGVHEGVLKGNGRMIVGSVTPEIYKRIEEYAVKASGADAAAKAETRGPGAAKSAIEQNTNNGGSPATAAAATTSTLSAPSPSKPAGVAAPDAWDALRVGDHVVAKYWEADGTPMGWWVGIIVEIVSDNIFIIRWPDEHKTPPLKIERKHVAILHRSYDVNTEWLRRR
jgi:hypothetical protein